MLGICSYLIFLFIISKLQPNLPCPLIQRNNVFQIGWVKRYVACSGKLAEQAQLQTQRSYNRAHIILLVIDALTVQQGHHGLLKRELALVRDIVKEGRAIVVLLNKVDTVEPGRLLEVASYSLQTDIDRTYKLFWLWAADCLLYLVTSTQSDRQSSIVYPALSTQWNLWKAVHTIVFCFWCHAQV